MSNINLLPWRQEIRERQRNAFMRGLISFVVIGALAVVLAYFAIDWLDNQEKERATFLRGQIALVDREIAEIKTLKEKKQELIDRMNAIDSLQQSRNVAVHLYSDLPTLTATGIYLTSMKFDKNIVSVRGLAESNPRVSSMLRNIDNSKWLGNSAITQTKAEERDGKRLIPTLPDGLYTFDMQFKVMNAVTANNTNKGGK